MQLFYTSFGVLVVALLLASMLMNGEGSFINNSLSEEALRKLLIKASTTKQITRSAQRQSILLNIPNQFQMDFVLEHRAPTEEKHMYKGRAIVSNSDKGNSRIKVHAISRHAQKGTKKRSIYFDSDMFAYTKEDHHEKDEAKSQKIIVPTSPVAFHSLFEALEKGAYFISEEVPIFDSAPSRLCPPKTMNRLAVFFEHQHYMLCFEKTGASQPVIVAQIESLKYIIGQEFIVEIVNVKTESNTRVRGGSMAINTGSSGLPITEEQLMDEKAVENFPKTPQSFKKPSTEQELLKKTSKPTEAFFLNSKSHVCTLPWTKGDNCKTVVRAAEDKKICFFLHGAGQWPKDKGEPVNNFPSYWGPVTDYTPQCSERWYIREETKYRGWDNPDLQRTYCDLLLLNHLPDRKVNGTVVKNAIIFTHSMGNLILAAAIKNGVCSVDKKTVSWYDVQGPLRGTPAIDILYQICNHTITFKDPSVTKFIGEEGGYCSAENLVPYEAYRTLHPKYKGLSDLEPIIKSHIKGQMCGTSSFGLSTLYSFALELFSIYIDYKEPNDGLVPFSSCGLGENFGSHFSDGNYQVAANHADGTCMNGDAYFGPSKPCSYYSGKI